VTGVSCRWTHHSFVCLIFSFLGGWFWNWNGRGMRSDCVPRSFKSHVQSRTFSPSRSDCPNQNPYFSMQLSERMYCPPLECRSTTRLVICLSGWILVQFALLLPGYHELIYCYGGCSCDWSFVLLVLYYLYVGNGSSKSDVCEWEVMSWFPTAAVFQPMSRNEVLNIDKNSTFRQK
jgi:hypothetical protein